MLIPHGPGAVHHPRPYADSARLEPFCQCPSAQPTAQPAVVAAVAPVGRAEFDHAIEVPVDGLVHAAFEELDQRLSGGGAVLSELFRALAALRALQARTADPAAEGGDAIILPPAPGTRTKRTREKVWTSMWHDSDMRSICPLFTLCRPPCGSWSRQAPSRRRAYGFPGSHGPAANVGEQG